MSDVEDTYPQSFLYIMCFVLIIMYIVLQSP